MNKLQACGILATFGLASAALAQAPTATEPNPSPSTSQTEGTAADRTPPGRTATRPPVDMSPTSPTPSTATGADRTTPGAMPTEPAGRTGVAGTAGSKIHPKIVGAEVSSSSNQSLGNVLDVVTDENGQPSFVVISTNQGTTTAVPYTTATSMMKGDKLVMDESRLQNAPKVDQGAWRSQSGNDQWKTEAMRYWGKGSNSMRSASPGGAHKSPSSSDSSDSSRSTTSKPSDRG